VRTQAKVWKEVNRERKKRKGTEGLQMQK